MRLTVSGIVTDRAGEAIPGAKVYVTDSKGALTAANAKMVADSDGKFKLPVAIPFPNILSGLPSMMPIGSHITVRYSGYPDSITKIDFSSNDPMDIFMTPKTQTVEDVTVTATNVGKAECEAKGGVYVNGYFKSDGKTFVGAVCKLPTKPQPKPKPQPEIEEKTWWENNRAIVIIAGIGLILAGTVVVVATRKK